MYKHNAVAEFGRTSSARNTAVIYGAVMVSIIIALSPAVFFTFGYHNDFNAWLYDSTQNPQPEVHVLIALGRYLGALGEDLQFLSIHTIDDLWRWRLVAILSAALLAAYYLYIVSMRSPPTWQNACLTVAVFTLPTMQFEALWVSMFAFWTPPFLLALIAAHLLLRATARDILSDRSAKLAFALFTLAGFASLLCACFFYPMSATFVLVPLAHLVLTSNGRQARQAAVLAIPILGGAIVALFVIHKFIVLPRLSDVPYLGEYTYSFSGHLLSEAIRRLVVYFKDGTFLWLSLDIRFIPTLIALLFPIGVIVCAIRFVRGELKTDGVVNLMLAALLFIVAAGPLLIIEQFTVTYRVMLTMTGIEMLVLFGLLRQFPVSSLGLASVFAALGLGCAFVDVYGTSASNHADYQLFSKAVAGLPAHDFHAITVLRPNRLRRFLGFALNKEFGGLNPTEYIFDSLIGTRYNERASFDVTMVKVNPETYTDLKAPKPAIERDSIVIDTAPIYGLPTFADVTKMLPVVSASLHGMAGPANAVDGNPNTAWEAVGAFPMALEIDYPAARTFVGYTLSTIEEPDRMPDRWEVWVSADLVNWRRIEEATQGRPWTRSDRRNFKVEPTADVRGIKLVILDTDNHAILRLYEFTPEFER